jgi:hypothetical protein
MFRNRRMGLSCRKSTGSRSAGVVVCICDCADVVTVDSDSALRAWRSSGGNCSDTPEPPIESGRERAVQAARQARYRDRQRAKFSNRKRDAFVGDARCALETTSVAPQTGSGRKDQDDVRSPAARFVKHYCRVGVGLEASVALALMASRSAAWAARPSAMRSTARDRKGKRGGNRAPLSRRAVAHGTIAGQLDLHRTTV